MNETAFERALAEELPSVYRALRRRFPEAAAPTGEIAASARHDFKKSGDGGEKTLLARTEFFGWLYGIAFRCHVVNLVAAEMEAVRESITPLCRRLNVDREEVMQEAWLNAQRSIDSHGEASLNAYGKDDARRWLWRIAFNAAHDARRMLNRRPMSELPLDPPAPFVKDRTNLEALSACIGGLPDDQQQAVRLLLEGRKPARLAELLAVTIAQIYYLIRRAKLHLRDCIGEENRP